MRFDIKNHIRVNRNYEENVKNTLTEKEFAKAIELNDLEVYTQKGIQDFADAVREKVKRGEANELDIEKAKESIANLQKICITGDNNARRIVWIRKMEAKRNKNKI